MAERLTHCRNLAATLIFALSAAGCGVSVVSSTSGSTEQAAQPPTADKAQSPLGQPTTPVRKVDSKDVVDVVKGDIKGGEAASGGTPEDYLWQLPNPALIKDEPLNRFVRKIPSGRFEPALGEATLCAVAVETDDATGLARQIGAVRLGGRLEQARPTFWG